MLVLAVCWCVGVGDDKGVLRVRSCGAWTQGWALQPATVASLKKKATGGVWLRFQCCPSYSVCCGEPPRSRPDAARLAGDPLLLRAYDLRLVGPGGEVLAEEARAVEARFEAGGFFGLASASARRVGGGAGWGRGGGVGMWEQQDRQWADGRA